MTSSNSVSDVFQRRAYLHASFNGSRYRTELSVNVMHSFYLLAVFGQGPQVVGNMNTCDHENLAFLLDLARNFRTQVLVFQFDPTRCQRASKSAGQSPAGSGDYVVQRSCVRFNRRLVQPVVARYLTMHTEQHWLVFGWYRCTAERAAKPLDCSS